ncbi:carbonic anhydrase [Corynebacterium aurimucosum]|uniref:Beta-type carbonic anhydrase-like protein n=1 Tax=Corynebacterium aurimucosum (strain ATCC 700975 / DSM 44827 / CIP 107346 / CN-1) TaxID=548476 RepID=C3PJC5_CORA7|nr:carbonic anhydrase [Corynebacterium aurimucosum]ACP33811.1 beta-type carbonic anhydrase-like protein [Corynebacterium aurimucosum ATCC 700975]PMC72227.1 carbonate dehydratase [Corynebacterium aurimucosum]QQU92094.1 carbonic anhydrase [Corynebacterium aurimucosum]
MPLVDVPQNPQKVWEALQEGNHRLVTGNLIDVNQDAKLRAGLTQGQDPRVIVLACSDSRAPIEHVFNIGFGDAFVIRTAGHILDSAVMASLDYALENLKANLLVVMGHQSCGAVGAASDFLAGGDLPTGLQRPIIERVAAASMVAKRDGREERADFERENTAQTVSQIISDVPAARRLLDAGTLGIVGLRYLLEDSSVETVVLHGVK